VRLTPSLVARLGGREARWPDVRRTSDLALAERLTTAFPAIGDERGWAAEFGRELNATDDRDLFGDAGLPVIEGKHIGPHAVDVSASTTRIARHAARRRLTDARFERSRLAYRDVSGVANRVSLVAAIVPPHVVTTHTLFCLRTPIDELRQYFLCALLNSYVLNTIARMLMGGHLTTALVEGLPAPAWTGSRLDRRIAGLAKAIAARIPPQTPRWMRANARLQALVALRFEVTDEELTGVLGGFPLVPADELEAVRSAWRLRVARARTRTSDPLPTGR